MTAAWSGEAFIDLGRTATSPSGRRAAAVWLAIVALVFALAVVVHGNEVSGPPYPPVLAALPFVYVLTFCASAITAYLLFRQYLLVQRFAVGLLATAYALNGAFPLAQLWTSRVGFGHPIGSGESGLWVWLAGHLCIPMLVVSGALLSSRARAVSAWMLAAALGYFVVIIAGVSQAPPGVLASTRFFTPAFTAAATAEAALALAALAALAWRTRLCSVLDLWLAVALCALLADIATYALFPARGSLAHWIAPVENLIAAAILLPVLFSETGRLNALVAEQRHRLATIVEGVAEGLLTVDGAGRITWCNAAAARMLDSTPRAICGSSVNEWIPRYAALEAGSPTLERETTARRGDGTAFPIETAQTVHAMGDEEPQTIVIIRDIAERKRVQESLAKARDQALGAARAKAEFLASMSHEIRTPINAIVGMSELMLETALNPNQREYAQTIARSAEALLSVIDDILDVSKLEAGKVDIESLPFDPLVAVESAADIVAGQARKKSLSLVTFVDPAVPRRLWGDENRLRQILLNLLSNAVKFTEQGEVVVRAAAETIEPEASTVRFSVEDTGIGIPPEVQERLFVPFEQADQSTRRKFGGTGLGLSISRRLVGLMGGRMGVESRAGAGSTFWFTIRFEHEKTGISADGEPLRLAGMRVLVVDDDANSSSILQQYLQAWGLESETAAEAETALGELRAAAREGRRFNVALIDLRMPGHDGAWLGEQIAADPLLAGTRAIMMTAYDTHAQSAVRSAGTFSHFLRKPIRQSMLFDALSDSVQRAALLASPAPSPPLRSASGTRLLLVEDHPVNRTMALRQLERLGFQADVAENGHEAVVAVEHGSYALVFMDCQLPEIDGFEATRAIRRREATTGRHVPIIAMTANAMEGDRETCLAAGMDDYVAKPVRLDDLRRVLEQYLGARAT
ncbi:MAG: response regulator [Candidatus Eremiobacteraeota bacterium]|nr:response regulator [Candidatus Eremiobacteraeota bacterium]